MEGSLESKTIVDRRIFRPQILKSLMFSSVLDLVKISAKNYSSRKKIKRRRQVCQTSKSGKRRRLKRRGKRKRKPN